MAKKEKYVTPVGQVQLTYHLFYKYPRDDKWIFDNEYDSKEDCEKAMSQTGEPEGIDYKVIKGIELSYDDAPAIYPYWIMEN
jgi:hypothetical protein